MVLLACIWSGELLECRSAIKAGLHMYCRMRRNMNRNTEIKNMDGQAMVEYLLLVLLIMLVALGAFVSFGGNVKSKTDYANEKFREAVSE